MAALVFICVFDAVTSRSDCPGRPDRRRMDRCKAWMVDWRRPGSDVVGYAQAVSTDPDQALQVSAELVPAWRLALRLPDAVAVAVVVVVCTGLAVKSRRCAESPWRQRGRRGLPGGGDSGHVAGTQGRGDMAGTGDGSVWFVYRAWRRRPVLAQVAPVPCSCSSYAWSAVAPRWDPARIVAGRSLVERIECSLTAGTDSMELKYSTASPGGPPDLAFPSGR